MDMDITVTANGTVIFEHSNLMAQDWLDLGLAIFFTDARVGRAQDETNVGRFMKMFGLHPLVVESAWKDMLDCGISVDGVQVLPLPSNKRKPKYFLMALYSLKKYPTETEREAYFDTSHVTARE
jgi:hypothetical protein